MNRKNDDKSLHGTMVRVIVFLDEPQFRGQAAGGDVLLMNRHMEGWIRWMYSTQYMSDYGLLTVNGRAGEYEINEVKKAMRRDADKRAYDAYHQTAMGMCPFWDADGTQTEQYVARTTSMGATKIRPKKGTALVLHGHDVRFLKTPGMRHANLNTFYSQCDHVGNMTLATFDYFSHVPETVAIRKQQLAEADGELANHLGDQRAVMSQEDIEKSQEEFEDMLHSGGIGGIGQVGW